MPLTSRAALVARHAVLWHQPAAFSRSLVYALVVAAVAVVAAPSAWVAAPAPLTDGHAILSMDQAIARAYCGVPSSFARGLRIPVEAGTKLELQQVPIHDLIVARAGSLDAYCRLIDQPFVNSDNSLMLLETAILKLMPGASLVRVAQALHLIRIACVLAFVLLVIDLGGSLGLALAALLCGLMLLAAMPDFVYTNYPFFFSLVLLMVAVYGFALKYRWADRPAGPWLFGLLAGVLSAFVANMRTSYLPIVAVFLACALVDELRRRGRALTLRRRGLRALVLAGSFVAAYAAFQAGLITRHLPDESRFNASHPFGHPLVLALAVPENDFSRAMGISWADEVGPRIANTVDPGVPFLGPRYNAALLKYYSTLWQTHTREMIGVYQLKFAIAGSDMLQVLSRSPGLVGWAVSILLAPLAALPNGLWLLGLYAVITAAAFAAYYRANSFAALALGLLSLAACLVQVESGVIFPLFVKQYHNYAAFYALFLALVGAQWLAQGAVALVARARMTTVRSS